MKRPFNQQRSSNSDLKNNNFWTETSETSTDTSGFKQRFILGLMEVLVARFSGSGSVCGTESGGRPTVEDRVV